MEIGTWTFGCSAVKQAIAVAAEDYETISKVVGDEYYVDFDWDEKHFDGVIQSEELKQLKKLLKKLIEAGIFTEEQAQAKLEEWLRDHPYAEEEPIEVTEEFVRQPVRVLEEVER